MPTATTLTITQHQQEQRPVLVLAGELDAATAPDVVAAALPLLDAGARAIIVDASGLTLCDANGLAVVVQIANRLRSQAGRLALVPSPAVSRALDQSGLTNPFMVASSVTGAIYAIFRDHP